ncbi:unnamed protein product [Absidia cylindrospora]
MPLIRLLTTQRTKSTYCRQCLGRQIMGSSRLNQQQQQRLFPIRPSTSFRSFHSSQTSKSPIIPLPAILLGLLKSGKLVSFVSLSSKTSLTLLPHTFRRDKGKLVGKILAGIPIAGLALLVAVGLDQAPNTSRLRFIYLSEQEEQEEVEKAIQELMEPKAGLIASSDSEAVLWLQTIVDNLAKAAQDDVRDPVRQYNNSQPLPVRDNDDDDDDTDSKQQEPKKYEVNLICDGNTLNAMCAGRHIVMYDLMMQAMDYDETKIAVILSHEIAHSIQRHFVETHGFASLLLMLGDITRGVFWMVTESFGPYVNQKINEAITGFIALESEYTYNRQLEREADLVGLQILAKAGYDPRVAIDVWTTMAEIEGRIKELEDEQVKKSLQLQQQQQQAQQSSRQQQMTEQQPISVGSMVENLISIWFGSSHPPSQERVEYIRQHLDHSIELYDDAIRLNGKPLHFDWNTSLVSDDSIAQASYFWGLLRYFFK